MKLTDLSALLGGAIPTEDREIELLLTDSRSLTFPQSTLFFALVTPRGDGHSYIPQLYNEGVRAFVVSKAIEGTYPGAVFIQVPDTLEALQTVGQARRAQLAMPILAITGSNGKTTTKELLYQLLSPTLSVGRSPRSYNSQIGVPLSLWGLEDTQALGIIEAGISRPGEMARLEAIIRPTYGAITNIGEAHQQHFESLEQKVAEKLQLFRNCRTLFAPYDNPLIRTQIETMGLAPKTLYWSREWSGATLFIQSQEYHPTGVTITGTLARQRIVLELPFLDQGTIDDTLLTLLIASQIAPQAVATLEQFAHLKPITMRLEVLEGKGQMLLINDSYNSDYDSLRTALDFMKRRNPEGLPTALILSDMEDSSHNTGELYARVAQLLGQYHIDRLYLVGQRIVEQRALFRQVDGWFPDWASLDKGLPYSLLAGHIVLLKGSNSSQFGRVIENWKVQTHQTILSINLTRLAHNYHTLRTKLPKGMGTICMIKANGYGAGAYEVARTLERAGTDYLAVAVVDEGRTLREQGIKSPILVMNPELSAFRQLIWNGLEPEIFSLEMLQAFSQAAETYGDRILPIHLKWNTGMNRLGLMPHEVAEVVDLLHRSHSIRVESIFTHLAAADDPSEDDFTRTQLARLDEVQQRLEAGLGYSVRKHALNTAGAIRFPEYRSDYVRLGIGLYGITPLVQDEMGLEPIATLTTQILQVQELAPGETVGYSRKGKIEHHSRIGIIPVGYADGLPRLLGNGHITFRLPDGTLVPTIGNICMDTLMLDLTDAPSAVAGTEVTLFGDGLPITRLSDACQTIPYEILSRLSSRIARQYYSE
ncbi:bifunctional UDP-N-acetylmuramoyl-tripeptide:D-alanyl-D-alanine ligase/alanine racemase [Porphyromonas levii]|uniref:bifunctional UDP-N-acetylmuramoyl-tripeptide:D-alanyl-D-alanine ligase/alanine racemase n=1 Tax=Porphyromonas levii TaxID=28114 RepID=UPI001B8BE975|nr:bifunctional UDP-N-acetylmuramoyl-tripeptide:D-alanyl-D-alanine ligase/alanine racemase [Porphyromonas levii]MBR8712991.1 Alanine racemase [Porphyromonas levii]MBR8715038.1 Alanine racemase [Porphyromonas levii]MBR8727523.1 Alanine racemase [Porphyromonas levii]MBR8735858.1 Alanine racemase [Porphyromonas levii]MBR8777930.1 Alanine racemase [Porphyromonas levii]